MKVTIVFVLIAFITRISSLSLQQTIFLQLLKNNLLGILNNDNLDKNCVSDLNALFSDVSSFKHWALQSKKQLQLSTLHNKLVNETNL